jgi:hypothetical protein
MFKIKNNTKKIPAIFTLCMLVFMELFPSTAMAITPPVANTAIGNVSNAAGNQAGGQMNKTDAPEVDVTFSGDMKNGSKVTANAVTTYFKDNDSKKLYFTWYLKKGKCELTDKKYPSGVDENGKIIPNDNNLADKVGCDEDDDKIITVNDWKITAAKISVKGSFDANGITYSNSIDEKLSAYKANPSPIETTEDKNNNNVWKINSGSETNDPDSPNCYARDPKSGLMYELRRVIEQKPTCSDSDNYELACIETNKTANCDVLNPAYDAVAALAAQQAIDAANAWNNDPANNTPANIANGTYPKVIPAKYGVSNTLSWMTDKFCGIVDVKVDKVYCKIGSDDELRNFRAHVGCYDNTRIPMCVKKKGNTYPKLLDSTSAANPSAAVIRDFCGTLMPNNNVIDPAIPSSALLISPPAPNLFGINNPIFADVIGQKCETAKNIIINGDDNSASNSSAQESCTFVKDANMCKHLFPKIPGAITGDNKFGKIEKSFWGTDPTKASTSGIGKDEEIVAGLGVEKFSWSFSTGDQVGVVVEGDSTFPTDHADSAYKRTWAFSKNTCSELEKLNNGDIVSGFNNEKPDGKRGFYIEGAGNAKTGFLTAEINLDNCLEENLLNPIENSTSGLKVDLTVDPLNPLNDPSGRGDILKIYANSVNSADTSGLMYNWYIKKSRDGSDVPGDSTEWVDITNKKSNNYTGWDGYSFEGVGINGLNKHDLSFNLNFTENMIKDGFISGGGYNGVFYLKVKVVITGTAADGGQSSYGETLPIRIRQQKNKMLAYPVIAKNDGMLNLNKDLNGSSLELCADKDGQSSCYVVKDQILGLEVKDAGSSHLSNFSWTVNGVATTCSNSISSECSLGGNKMFIPVLGNIGEAVDISAKAHDDTTGEAIEVSRHFVIGTSALNIISNDQTSFCGKQCLDTSSLCPKYLGSYLDTAGNAYPDCSTSVWETREGNTVSLFATGQSGFDWSVDGEIMTQFKDQDSLEFLVDRPAGSSYNIGLSTYLLDTNKAQLGNIRRALYNNWKVEMDAPSEENKSTSIQIDVVPVTGQDMATAKNNFFGASLITHLPENLIFLLKISLTSILMLFATGLLFAFIPENIFEKR